MKHFSVITLFPDMFNALQYSVIKRAFDTQLIDLTLFNPRKYSTDRHKTVDNKPYGGGPGMVMTYSPLTRCIQEAKASMPNDTRVVYLSPQGERLTQAGVKKFAALDNLILLSGRYEGIDERIITQHVDYEVSIGDYIISGGELAAMVLIDAITRTIKGALGSQQSAEQDSYSDGLLEYPHYTRPEYVDGLGVPDVLLSGDHQAIARWRRKQILGRTWKKRPDLLAGMVLSETDEQLLREFIVDEKEQLA